MALFEKPQAFLMVLRRAMKPIEIVIPMALRGGKVHVEAIDGAEHFFMAPFEIAFCWHLSADRLELVCGTHRELLDFLMNGRKLSVAVPSERINCVVEALETHRPRLITCRFLIMGLTLWE